MELSDLKTKSIFKSFSNRKTENEGKLTNILDCRGDVIFLWDNTAGCLLTQGTRSICTKHQELHPTERPEFEISNITVNESGTRAALWGFNGVAVMDLPWRCGPKLEYQDGKDRIITRCRVVDNLDLGYGGGVVQVRWNPSSISDSSLIVLVSENSLYQIDMMPLDHLDTAPLQVGARPLSRLRTLPALGETAVDFCFIPMFVETEKNKAGATVILVLRGNGDVAMVSWESDAEIFPEGQPLPISPLPDDHYLTDSCAIISIPGKPAGVVLATTRGVLYHALLVPLDVDQVDVPLISRKYRLLVVESIVLDLGLLTVPDDLSVFPLRLVLDSSHPRRYLAIHPCGVHSVFVDVLSGVENLLSSSAQDKALSKEIQQSSLEYLICTGRVLLGYVAFPYTLIAIDSEHNVIVLELRRIQVPPFQLFTPEQQQSEQEPLTRQMRQPFRHEIEQLLLESRVLPQIQFPKQELPREQLLALIVRLANLVRKVTIPKYRQVRSILNHRMQLIRTVRALQLEELASLEEHRDSIQLSAESFAERVQVVSDNFEEHRERVKKVVRHVAEANPSLTDAELGLQGTVSEIQAKLKDYSSNLEKLKKSVAYQEMKIHKEPEKQDVTLSNKQATTIHNCLSVVGENISQLVQKVNSINSMIGLTTD